MFLVFVAAGLAAGYLLLKSRAAAQGVPLGPSFAQQFAGTSAIGVNPSLQNVGANTTDQQVTGGLQAAASYDPEPISQGFLKEAAMISGLFTQAHAAAMKREAVTLNNAIPTFIKEVQYTMAGLNGGAITEAQAIEYLNQAQADFYQTVGGIMHKGGPCTVATSTTTKPSGTPNLAGLGTGAVDKYGCPNVSGTCNAACCVACYTVEPAVRNLTAIIKAGGGSYTIEAHGSNGQIAGNAAVRFAYMRAGSGGSVMVQDMFSSLGL